MDPKIGFRIMIGGEVFQTIDAEDYDSIPAARDAAHALATEESNKRPNNSYSVVPFGERLRAYGASGRG